MEREKMYLVIVNNRVLGVYYAKDTAKKYFKKYVNGYKSKYGTGLRVIHDYKEMFSAFIPVECNGFPETVSCMIAEVKMASKPKIGA